MFDILLGTSSLLRLQSPKFRPRKFRTARNNFVPHHRHVTLIVCSLTWIGSRVHLWKRRLINRKRSKKLYVLEKFWKFSKIIETFYFPFNFWSNENVRKKLSILENFETARKKCSFWKLFENVPNIYPFSTIFTNFCIVLFYVRFYVRFLIKWISSNWLNLSKLI